MTLSVGLTGGIGSGKSAVSRLLAAHGAIVVDADLLARESLAPGSEGLAAVVAEFGAEVLGPDGALDRSRLGAVVFADGARRAALEAIVHPYVRRRSRELEAAAPEDAVVVHDVPLLVENALQDQYDLVVVVDVDEATQVERLGVRGMAEHEAMARIAAQATRAQRLAVADEVLDNTSSLDALTRQVAGLWGRLQARRAG